MYPSEFDGFHGVGLALLIASGFAAAAWLAVLAWRWFATFPYLPDAAAPTRELGTEQPAVVNLLVHRWRLTRPAIAATLLDLAARKLLAVEQYGDQVVVRAYSERAEGQRLSAYERQVFDHVVERVRGRSVPVDALELTDEAESDRFWKRFSSAVTDEARRRGLARSRWTHKDRVLVGAFLAVALGLLAFAFGVAGLGRDPGADDDMGQLEWLVVSGLGWFAVTTFIFTRRTIRETPEGLAVCSRWLGVKEGLRESDAFGDVPAAAVITWERYLAYAVALGIAHRAAADLPFDTEDPETAWSRYTGNWRELRVEYPKRLGATQRPINVVLSGLGQSALWGGLAFIALPIVGRVGWELAHDLLRDSPLGGDNGNYGWLLAGFAAGVAIAGSVLVVRFAIGMAWLLRGLADLGTPETIEGEVVKMHAGRVAVDDGRSDEVIAWLPPAGSPVLARGMRVRIRKTRRLHYVPSVEVVARAPGENGPGRPAAREGRETGEGAQAGAPPAG